MFYVFMFLLYFGYDFIININILHALMYLSTSIRNSSISEQIQDHLSKRLLELLKCHF